MGTTLFFYTYSLHCAVFGSQKKFTLVGLYWCFNLRGNPPLTLTYAGTRCSHKIKWFSTDSFLSSTYCVYKHICNWFWLESCCSSSNWWLNCYWLFRTIHNFYREQRLTYQSISFLFISQLNSSLRAGRKLVSLLYFTIVYDQIHYFCLGPIPKPKMANTFSR